MRESVIISVQTICLQKCNCSLITSLYEFAVVRDIYIRSVSLLKFLIYTVKPDKLT